MDIDLVWSCSRFAINPDGPHTDVEGLKESIRQHGIREPLVLETSGPRVKKFNVPYFLIDGNHRLKAAKDLGLTEVPVRFIKQWHLTLTTKCDTI
jgi:ParB-like chromosome segregation protein Spo0J